MKHITEEELFSLVDGGIAPNQEEPLRKHLATCEACRKALDEMRDLKTDLGPEVPVDLDAHVHQVMAGVEARRAEAHRPRPSRTPRRRAWVATGMTALALAAGVALFVDSRRREHEGEFTTRGSGSESTLVRDVGVRIFAGERQPVLLENGAVVAPDVAFSAAYTNLHAEPAYLLLFAVDGANVVHWLYPAYTRADENPASVMLQHTDRESLMPTSVVLEAPLAGALRVVSVVTKAPIHVHDIEKRPAVDLERGALERDLGAAVTERRIIVKGPQ